MVRQEKQITVCLIQTMIGRCQDFTSGYFDVVVMDECHRSIYGAWQTALSHFDALHIGLTATPAVYIERNTFPEVDPNRALITPRRGDLLFSRANTRELVAASCIVEADYPNLFLPDKLWRIAPFPNVAKSTFLKELFWNSGIRDKFRADSSGSSGSMLNISQNAVLRTEVPMPPLSLQEQFDQRAWSVMEIARKVQQTSLRLEHIWSELMKRAFSGQLTANWREAHMKELLAEMEAQARQLNLPMPQEEAV
jgi:hypothetical protein